MQVCLSGAINHTKQSGQDHLTQEPNLFHILKRLSTLDIKLAETNTGCPAKKFTFFKSAYLRPLISLRKSSILEMNLWISSFKSTKSEFSRIFRFRDIKGIKHMLHFSRYIWLTFEPSEMSNYSKMACIWPKIIIFQV